MSRLPEIFVKRIELPGGGHADACAMPDAAFGKEWSSGELRGFLKNCGIGSGGFEPGNDCAKGDGGTAVSSGGKASDKVKAWANRKWGDEKGPNGKSKAENFAEWFGDSKVVDANGEPLVVYHGTTAKFNQFDPSTFNSKYKSELGDGFYFSAYKDVAAAYAGADGEVKEVYLALQNPVHAKNATEAKAVSRSGEHDGVMYSADSRDGNPYEFVAFDPSQIKSATGNAGNFDSSETDIRKSLSLKNCGTGDGGFRPGNTCGKGDGASTGYSVSEVHGQRTIVLDPKAVKASLPPQPEWKLTKRAKKLIAETMQERSLKDPVWAVEWLIDNEGYELSDFVGSAYEKYSEKLSSHIEGMLDQTEKAEGINADAAGIPKIGGEDWQDWVVDHFEEVVPAKVGAALRKELESAEFQKSAGTTFTKALSAADISQFLEKY